jgi:general secretion pathway protein G
MVRMKKQNIHGFTLIEIMIVMSIIALLLTIALPRYFGSIEKSKEVALKENLKVLRLSLDKFYADKGRYPQNLQEIVENRYLRAVPLDPVTESPNTWMLIPSPDAKLPGIADVKSGAQGLSRDGILYENL